ncbi:MAG TPA: hypothetical protein PKC45_01090 [Gemmatales bacterium]|nr:hypothetical protein [Gemmatales bacterium]
MKPFGTSPHHGLTSYDGLRLMDIKAATLGYRGCTIQEHDEDKVYEYPGPPGLVAGQQDAERLVAALATEYPRVPFRIELAPFILSQILWEREPVQESDAGAS